LLNRLIEMLQWLVGAPGIQGVRSACTNGGMHTGSAWARRRDAIPAWLAIRASLE